MCVGKINSEEIEMMPKRPIIKKRTVTNSQKYKMINTSEKTQYQDDILAVSTYYTKIFLLTWGELFRKFQDSNIYKICFNTTQPAHVITAFSVITVSFLLFPSENKTTLKSPIWTLIYLGSYCAHFGAQIWMTFVSGLALYFTLPRHSFGNIQKILFPKYFLLNSILSFMTLSIFVMGHNNDLVETQIALQVGAMVVCFLVELAIRLYLTPPLLKLITVKNAMEKEAGVGMEIGKLVAGDLLKCPHYVKIHKAFRKIHMSIAIGNIVAMCCTMFHLYYLSQKLCMF